MGIVGLWAYGNADLGSAIEATECVIAKIKTNKYDKDDLVEFKTTLSDVVSEIEKALTANEA
jgi:hypothetical protein